MAVTFDENTDYQALINEAAAKKDYKAAAQYEQQRNAKIKQLDATGTNKWNATATNNYAGWLDDTDYGTVGQQQMASGASWKDVLDTYNARYNKAANTEGLKQYANDDIQQEMLNYILNGMNSSQQQASTAPQQQTSTPSYDVGEAPVLADLTGKAEDYSSYLEQMYAAKKAAALADIEAAYQSNVNALDRAGEGLEKTYQDARNQTAGASELAKRNFAQHAAANGLNSGTGGQAELARNIALQNNLNTVNTQEAQSVADLQLQRANAEVEYNNAIAQAQAEGDYELANALYQEKVRVQNALIELEIQQYQLEYQAYRDKVGDSQWQQSFDQSVKQQEWQNLFNQAQFDYAKAQDAIANSQWQQSFDQSAAQQEWQNLFNQAQFDYAKAQDAIANSQWQQSFDQNAAQQEWQNGFNQQQYQDAMTQQEWENTLALQKYKDSLVQQQYENSLASQKYQDSQTAAQKEILASYGAAYLEAGVMPSDEMLSAMGITEADAQTYIKAVQSADGANLTTVGEALTEMVRAGANMTELRSALRGALNEGILTQAEYEQLCGIYLPGWRT